MHRATECSAMVDAEPPNRSPVLLSCPPYAATSVTGLECSVGINCASADSIRSSGDRSPVSMRSSAGSGYPPHRFVPRLEGSSPPSGEANRRSPPRLFTAMHGRIDFPLPLRSNFKKWLIAGAGGYVGE